MMRLSRYLARAGAASRRGAERLIEDGRVTVNGTTIRQLGTKVEPAHDEVRLDGQMVALPAQQVTLMLHKPAGYVTTMDDPQGRPTVAELVPLDAHPSLFPIGRLDFDTTGLLLFTTDGDLGNALAHPRHVVDKRYLARTASSLSNEALDRLRHGVMLDGRMTAPARVQRVQGEPHPTYAITIHEGRNRQVRRMFEAVGTPVTKLHRAQIGPLTLGDLPCGCWRELDQAEVNALIGGS